MRIFALSDIHVDYPENMAWVRAMSAQDYVHDTLLLAGDVSHDFARIEAGLGYLLRKFARVFFIPGNHEVWLPNSNCSDSEQKFYRVLDLSAALGVSTRPTRLSDDSSAVWIVPLLAWYVKPEEGDGSLFVPKTDEDGSLDAWSDEYFVQWPFCLTKRPADFFLELNVPYLDRTYDAPVISFSHFLPRAELMFDLDRDGRGTRSMHGSRERFNFSRVAGTWALDEQIRKLGSSVHVYGHQHRNRWRAIDGVLYVSHCLGYSEERESGQLLHFDNGPKLVWEKEGVPKETQDY